MRHSAIGMRVDERAVLAVHEIPVLALLRDLRARDRRAIRTERAKTLGNIFGETRELDVFALELLAPVAPLRTA